MDAQAYKEWVEKYSKLAAETPSVYRRRVNSWIWVGYAFFFTILLAATLLLYFSIAYVLGGHGGSGSVRLAFFAGIVVFWLLRSLFIKVPAPVGRPISQSEAPLLFESVESMRRSLNVRPIRSIVAVPDYNAFATTSTAIGPFGEQLHIGLGMDLLAAMDKDQVLAVIAHELGHHARGHTASGARTHKVFRMWQTIVEGLALSRSLSTEILSAFCQWYMPRLDAVTSAARKANEFEADAVAAQLTSQRAAAGGLVRINVDQIDRLERLSDQIHEEVQVREAPTPNMSQLLANLVRSPVGAGAASKLADNLRLKSHLTDSHPSLSERLQAMGVQVDPDDAVAVAKLIENSAGPLEVPAGEELLGQFFNQLQAEFDAEYVKNAQSAWTRERCSLEKAREDLAHGDTPLLDQALAAWRLEGPESAWPRMQSVLAQAPPDAKTLFLVGKCALDNGLEEGIGYLRAASEDAAWRVESLNRLFEYYAEKGRQSELEATRIELEAACEQREGLLQLEGHLSDEDELAPYSISERELKNFDDIASKLKNVKKVFAFSRKAAHGTGESHPGYVFLMGLPAFVMDLDSFRLAQQKALSPLVSFPDDATFWVLTEKDKAFKWLTQESDFLVWEAKA